MQIEQNKLIPIMLCFNDVYSIPGMVAIYSLLKFASSDYQYNIHVMHSDISHRHQRLLQQVVARYSNANLFFHNMENKFTDIWEKVGYQAYWSKEIFYKCITSSFFPQYDSIVITDVDVVFCRDFTSHWEKFQKEKDCYLAGYRCLLKKSTTESEYAKMIYKDWDETERKKILTGAGFWFQNLRLMRQDDIEKKMLDYIHVHIGILRQPEQQVINAVCYPKILLLPPEGMILGYDYQNYKTEIDFHNDKTYTAEEVKYALEHPIQLHYAGGLKPWNAGFVSKSAVWWLELLKLGFITVILEQAWRFFIGRGYNCVLRNWIRCSTKSSKLMAFIYRVYKSCKIS